MDVVRAANARAAAGGKVLHLEVGQPGTRAPETVRKAAAQAVERELLAYTEAKGVLPLRTRIARHYHETYGVTVEPERIVITIGSSGAFVLSFLAAFDTEDRVAMASPGYPAYRNILTALDVTPVELPTTMASRFQPTPELLEATPGPLAGLIVASPANPTGTMLAPDELGALVRYCADRGIRFISDEIYHGITYGRAAATALAYDGRVIVINSFSKYYSMTGWRLGWMIVPPDLTRAVEVLQQNMFISPPTLAQLAAVAAFDARDELDANVAVYRANRDLLLAELPAAGIDRFAPPDGAFYLYADVSSLTNDSAEYCRRLLDETGIAITPGIDFDTTRGNAYVRFSFSGPTADIAAAVELLKRRR